MTLNTRITNETVKAAESKKQSHMFVMHIREYVEFENPTPNILDNPCVFDCHIMSRALLTL